MNHASTNGSGPAHVAVDAAGAVAVAVNYGSGDVTTIPIQPDGSLGTPSMAMKTGANAHQIVFDPTNAFAFVPNKGSDTVSSSSTAPRSRRTLPRPRRSPRGPGRAT